MTSTTTPMMMMISRTESADSNTSIESSTSKKKPGDVVHCYPFGDGKVLQLISYDDDDATSSSSSSSVITYKVRLAFGTLYASEQGIIRMNEKHHNEWKKRQQQKQTQQAQKASSRRAKKSTSSKSAAAANSSSNSTTTTTDSNDTTDTDPGATMALNVAYEALETMRKLNLELSCQELGVPFDGTKCTRCLLSQQNAAAQQQQQQYRASAVAASAKKGTPCFICASPTCKSHSCATFRKEGNTVCQDCKHLYSLDYVLAILTMATRSADNDIAQSTCAQLLARMLDTYDRTVLVLKYSAQFMPDIIQSLETNKSLKNKVGIGSSSVGLMSGSLGIAATACLLTPVSAVFAPPLIIASILCGGTSSALQTGVEMGTAYSEPNQLATRIIALYGMCKSILRTVQVLQDLVDMLQQDEAQKLANGKVMQLNGDAACCFAANHETARLSMVTTTTENGVKVADTTKALTTTTTRPSSSSLTTANKATEVGSAAGKNARFITRSGASSVSMSSNAVSASGNALSASMMTAAQFATFAGGALSAAVLVCEAHSMTQTIIDIRNGSKCPRADLLRQILHDLTILPLTMDLDRQAHDATIALTNLYYPDHRHRRMSMEDAKQLLIDLLGPDQVPNYVDDLKKHQQQQQQNQNNKNKFMRGRFINKLRSRNENDATVNGSLIVVEENENDDHVATNEMRSFISQEGIAQDSFSSCGVVVVDSETTRRRGFWRAWTT